MSQYYIRSRFAVLSFQRDSKSLFYYVCLYLLFIAIETGKSSAWVSDGLCAETLGNAINSFIDRCFRGNHFFMDMRNGHLRDLYKVNCCPGYKQVSRMGGEIICKPVCKRICVGGDCIKPDTCQCKRGYFQKSQYECLPLCQPSCINGDCLGVDLCICHHGYRLMKGSRNECKPVCEDCINGKCVSPGVCQCNEGFTMKKNSISECKPNCDPPCVNAICIAAGECQCLLGYAKEGNRSCKPVCKNGCGLGICSAPEICSCPEGYQASFGEPCKPICKGCANGSCVFPDICFCPEGYSLNNTTYECNPACDSCYNGQCVKPNECICKPGYAKEEGDVFCKPICNPECINGQCKGPGICECYGGYKLKLNSSYKCEPICSKGCINSTCIAPESCRCMLGYEQVSSYSCRPVCTEGCGLGVCSLPDYCECPYGYHADSGHTCEPTCSVGCENGHCVAPETCFCSSGHSLVNGVCKPICDKNCINSYCTSSNLCECFSGFKYFSDSECVPQCSTECINGQCSSPETCTCNLGFNAHPEDSSICLPKLSPYFSHKPTTFLNVFNIPSILTSLEDNETFYFEYSPVLKVNTPCNIIFQNIEENRTDVGTGVLWVLCQPTDSPNKQNTNLYCQWPSTNDTIDGINNIYNLNNTNNSLISSENIKEPDLTNLTIFIIFPEEYSSNHAGVCTFSFHPSSPSKYISLYESSYFTVSVINSTYIYDDIHSVEGTSYAWIVFMISIMIITILTMTGLALKLIVERSSSLNNMQHKFELDDMLDKRESEENRISTPELSTEHNFIDDIENT